MIFGDKVSKKFKGEGDPEVKTYLQKIVRSSQRMQHLINDLLKFSRHTDDNFGFEPTDLNEIIKEVLLDLELEIQQKNAQIFSNKLPVIWAIPTQISQLFQNIISNSIKFCKSNCAPQIFIETEETTGADIDGLQGHLHDHKFHRIYFKDNGIGFDQKYVEDIFMVFKRLHSYHEFEGTGIGLSICKKIVEKHRGFIGAKSKINEGSTFVVTLPQKSIIPEKPVLKNTPVE
jgi:hypothetical protein